MGIIYAIRNIPTTATRIGQIDSIAYPSRTKCSIVFKEAINRVGAEFLFYSFVECLVGFLICTLLCLFILFDFAFDLERILSGI